MYSSHLASNDKSTFPDEINLTVQFPILHKHGVCLDFENPNNIDTIQSIIRELEILGKSHDLFFKRKNNTIAKPFFLPNGILSYKRFNEWENDGMGFCSISKFMSNGVVGDSTDEPIAVFYIMKLLSKYYPSTFDQYNKSMGYNATKRMNVIETAAVLSDMGVGDKKVLGTL
jgi:hypothetical protein